MTSKNVFVVGLNDFNHQMLRNLHGADGMVFHRLLDPGLFYDTEIFDMPALIEQATARLEAFDGSIDAIAGYMDFPVSTMLPLLCERFGTTSASLEALLKCEHKYWSRVCQREVIPEHVPRFAAFDPFDDGALGTLNLAFPFFVKPIKSSGSRLGFRIEGPEDFDHAMEQMRASIATISEPFDFVLGQLELPPEVAAIGGGHCLAEEIIGGRQCTVEGYCYRGEVTCTGIVDSIRYPQVISFFRYQYPSKLPARVRRRMEAVTRRVIEHIGYDNASFNIEYFWDEVVDRIWLLEINTRISQSHSLLFEKVDGVSNQQLSIDLALGRRPHMPHREGESPLAAKFFHRVFQGNAKVVRVPTPEEIRALETRVPGTRILPQVRPGMWLSELPEQDSYSYALAYIYMGARNQSTLLRQYDQVIRGLRFELAQFDESLPRVGLESEPPG